MLRSRWEGANTKHQTAGAETAVDPFAEGCSSYEILDTYAVGLGFRLQLFAGFRVEALL